MIVAVVLIALAAVAFSFLLIVPQFGTLGQLQQGSDKAETDIASAKSLLARRQEAKVKAAETQAKLMQLDNLMPDSPQLPSLIIMLQEVANDAGLDLRRVAPALPADTGAGYSRIGLDMTLVGTWSDLIDFLRRATELDRGVRVLTVNAAPDGTRAATATVDVPQQLTVSVKLEAYQSGSASAKP